MKNEQNNEIDQYYSDISQQIIVLIKEKKYIQAINILNEELNQPYVPYDIYERLNQSKIDIERMQIEESYDKKFNLLTKREIWNQIYNEANHFIDISYISILLEKYEHEFNDYDVTMLNNILNNKHINNVDKWLLIELILQLKLDYPFSMYNSFLDKKMSFNLETLTGGQQQLAMIAKELTNILAKQPSELEIALQLLQALYTKFIPNQISFNNHDIINTLKNVVLALFNHEQLVENEITKLLKEFLE